MNHGLGQALPNWMIGKSRKPDKGYYVETHNVLPDEGCEPCAESEAETPQASVVGKSAGKQFKNARKPRKCKIWVNIHGKRQQAYYWKY